MELPAIQFREFLQSDKYKQAESRILEKFYDIRQTNTRNDPSNRYDYIIVLIDESKENVNNSIKHATYDKSMYVRNSNRGSISFSKSQTNYNNSGSYPMTVYNFVNYLRSKLKLEAEIEPQKLQNNILIKLHAPIDTLEIEAESMKLNMRLKRGGWLPFNRQAREHFIGSSDATSIFCSSQRQAIIDHILRKSNLLQNNSMIIDMFPLHKVTIHKELTEKWVHFHRNKSILQKVRGSFRQPLDAIAHYYGEYVAFYFAFLEWYTLWLIAPAVAGMILMYFKSSDDDPFNDILIASYAFFLGMWATLFIEFWRRRTVALAYRWGVLHYEDDIEDTRPEFEGSEVIDPKTGVKVIIYSRWKRYMQLFITAIMTLLCSCTLGCVMILILIEVDSSVANPQEEEPPWEKYFYIIILWSIIVPLSDWLFSFTATRLTKWENHRTESKHRSHLIGKIFSFRFVNNFISLYYYAFADWGIARLTAQLGSFLIMGQSIQLIGTYLASLRTTTKKEKELEAEIDNINKKEQRKNKTIRKSSISCCSQNKQNDIEQQQITTELSNSWKEKILSKYNNLDDYTSLIIQFGYVTFFSFALPLGPLFVLIINLLRIRLDANRLCSFTRRPVAKQASGIGLWMSVLDFMSVTAALTNCAIIGFTSRHLEHWYPNLGTSGRFAIVFFAEHILLGAKFLIAWLVPTVPRHVRKQIRKEKQEYFKATGARLATTLPYYSSHKFLEFMSNPKYLK